MSLFESALIAVNRAQVIQHRNPSTLCLNPTDARTLLRESRSPEEMSEVELDKHLPLHQVTEGHQLFGTALVSDPCVKVGSLLIDGQAVQLYEASDTPNFPQHYRGTTTTEEQMSTFGKGMNKNSEQSLTVWGQDISAQVRLEGQLALYFGASAVRSTEDGQPWLIKPEDAALLRELLNAATRREVATA